MRSRRNPYGRARLATVERVWAYPRRCQVGGYEIRVLGEGLEYLASELLAMHRGQQCHNIPACGRVTSQCPGSIEVLDGPLAVSVGGADTSREQQHPLAGHEP